MNQKNSLKSRKKFRLSKKNDQFQILKNLMMKKGQAQLLENLEIRIKKGQAQLLEKLMLKKRNNPLQPQKTTKIINSIKIKESLRLNQLLKYRKYKHNKIQNLSKRVRNSLVLLNKFNKLFKNKKSLLLKLPLFLRPNH